MNTACELCGSADQSFFLEARGTNIMSGRFFRLVKCDSCGIVHLADGPGDDELHTFDFKEFIGSTAPFLKGFHRAARNNKSAFFC